MEDRNLAMHDRPANDVASTTGRADSGSSERVRRIPDLAGTLLLWLGAGIWGLLLAERSADLAWRLPLFWTRNRPMWAVLGLLGVVLGAVMLKMRSRCISPDAKERAASWQPSRPGRRFGTLVLYTRPGCHLCDQAYEQLMRYAPWLPPVRECNIETDARLEEKFGCCIPVVEIDGKVRFRGRINETLLRRMIEGSQPQQQSASPSAETASSHPVTNPHTSKNA